MFGYGKFIKPQGIENLKNWSYKAGQYTHLDNAMQPFWNWFVTLFPMVRAQQPATKFIVDGPKSYHALSYFLFPGSGFHDGAL